MLFCKGYVKKKKSMFLVASSFYLQYPPSEQLWGRWGCQNIFVDEDQKYEFVVDKFIGVKAPIKTFFQ